MISANMHVLQILFFCLFHRTMCIDNECFQSSLHNEMIPALVGQDTVLSCEVLDKCMKYKWRISSARNVYEDLEEGSCSTRYHTSCHEVDDNGVNVLKVNGTAVNQHLYYQCYCYQNGQIPDAFSCTILAPYVQLDIRVGRKSKLFNISCIGPSENHVINVTNGQAVSTTCSDNGNADSNCSAGANAVHIQGDFRDCFVKCGCSSVWMLEVTINVISQQTTIPLFDHGTTATEDLHRTEVTTLTTAPEEETNTSPTIYILLTIIAIFLLLLLWGLRYHVKYKQRNVKDNQIQWSLNAEDGKNNIQGYTATVRPPSRETHISTWEETAVNHDTNEHSYIEIVDDDTF